MEELLAVMKEIRDELKKTNEGIQDIKEISKVISRDMDNMRGGGTYNTITDLADKLDELIGEGCYRSIADVCDKLDRLN